MGYTLTRTCILNNFFLMCEETLILNHSISQAVKGRLFPSAGLKIFYILEFSVFITQHYMKHVDLGSSFNGTSRKT